MIWRQLQGSDNNTDQISRNKLCSSRCSRLSCFARSAINRRLLLSTWCNICVDLHCSFSCTYFGWRKICHGCNYRKVEVANDVLLMLFWILSVIIQLDGEWQWFTCFLKTENNNFSAWQLPNCDSWIVKQSNLNFIMQSQGWGRYLQAQNFTSGINMLLKAKV